MPQINHNLLRSRELPAAGRCLPVAELSQSEFEDALYGDWPSEAWKDVTVLVGVSGGPDSVACLRALIALRSGQHEPKGKIELAHFNHRWRGEASNEDELFVRTLARQLELTLHVGQPDSLSKTEEAARDQRYAFLKDVAERRGARYVVLAHTADDQAETILHRILRGTGLKGLSGIRSRRRLSEAVTIVRPILWAYRADVVAYLQCIGQPYQVDDSNFSLRFTRNRIRHQLLPHLSETYNPEVVRSLLRLGKLAEDAQRIVADQVEPLLDQCTVRCQGEMVELLRSEFMRHGTHVQREILCALWRRQSWAEKSMGFHSWSRLVESIERERKVTMAGGIVVETTDGRIRLTRQTINR